MNYLLEEIVQELNGIDSKFRLVILVSRRAKQLIGGARRKIEVKSENPLTVAMEEFNQGKIDFNVLNEEDNLFAAVDGDLQNAGEATEAELEEEEADIGGEEAEESKKEPGRGS
ncbi:MAG: DNA-directed RNA polymerase subunit omega [Candidatus Aminicenantes bacterium]|nr:DNA-directed RNA polymerase subunit omega [Candidatus Aminicenantes bacterium]